ncbi:MAG: bacillithiol biosynthesis cysteine-adding enzyme BshC [Bacteroidia bacterium]|nr:bacillithiol biosynthesis cysteine-adding enzyme BshC [Bacteroidia bacterium]
MILNKNYIGFEESNQFTKLIIDYVNQETNTKQFYSHFPSIENFSTQIKEKTFDSNSRKILAIELLKQYEYSNIILTKNSTTLQQINLLEQENTYTITTGHQLCLFTGPLYFIYKILSVIKWCEELKTKYPTYNFVPVFWMASEDHDFAEINHIYTSEGKINWGINSKNKPVGQLQLQNFSSVTDNVAKLATNNFAKKQLEEWINCYNKSKNLSTATRNLVHSLFAEKGLIIIDGDSKVLKKELVEIIKKDIVENSNYSTITSSNKLLKNIGYKTQVNGREINFFYINNSGRSLIKKQKEHYRVENTDKILTKEQLINEIENYPERFSPNVIIRPLYQEKILPNLAYIGGPGEIAYWLQLKSLFQVNNIHFPILVLRSFVYLIQAKDFNQLKKAGITLQDLFRTDKEIERKLIALNKDGGHKEKWEEINNCFQQIIDIAKKSDNKLSSEIIKLKTSNNKQLKSIFKKLEKIQGSKVSTKHKKVKSIKNKYFPNKLPQERYFNILEYGKTESIKELIHSIYNEISTTQNEIQLLEIY